MEDTSTVTLGAETLDEVWTPDAVEQRLIGIESDISRLRHEQLDLLRRGDLGQVAGGDGCRSL